MASASEYRRYAVGVGFLIGADTYFVFAQRRFLYGDGDDNVSLIDQLGDKRCCEDKWIDDISIKSALSELPERERKIILLRYYKGRTQTEISRIMGISQAQVSRLEKGALAYIREFVEP